MSNSNPRDLKRTYRVWLEPLENFSRGWECEAVSPEHAIKIWQSEADPPHGHTWDDEFDSEKKIEVAACRLVWSDDGSDDEPAQGETWRATMICHVKTQTTVDWKIEKCGKVG